VWDVAEEAAATRAVALEAAGHRSDVRAVALSSDDASLLSASSAAVKVRRSNISPPLERTCSASKCAQWRGPASCLLISG